jgi:hypothetical protein
LVNGRLVLHGFCYTSSNAPFGAEEGAVFVGAFRSDLDGLLEGWVDSGHGAVVFDMYRYRRSTEGHSSFIEPFPTYEVYLVNLGIFPRPWTAEKLSQLAITYLACPGGTWFFPRFQQFEAQK